jgi:hypothetical protein
MICLILMIFSLFGPSPAEAAPKFDTAQIHRIYMDGEFDKAIKLVESGLSSGSVTSHTDSVFAFKHLGVMYTANYETREVGKKYMYQLLFIEPTARIMDMYASDMIYMIFRNIQEEFEQNRMFMGMQRQSQIRADTPSAGAGTRAKKDTPRTDPRASDSRSSGGKKWIWGGFAVAAVAAGVGAYVLMNDHGVSGKDFEY